MSTNNTNESQWNISTDIYDIVSTIDNLKARYIDTEDETTLALGMFGFIGDTEAKKIQTNTIIAGELGNEMFPNRAKLDKNIITHAMYSNITNIDAVPAQMTIDIAIKELDLDEYMQNDQFIFDRNCPIYVGDYEFHFDYNIILTRKKRPGTNQYFYNAAYDMTEKNDISTITSPYLEQPYTINFNNFTYIFFRTVIHQLSIETTEDKLLSNNIIDNKSYTFSFSDQLASFYVYITEKGKTTKLTPLLYGTPVDLNLKDYCWYLYMGDNDIRIGFDTSSYLPGLNADIKIVAQTTRGAEGNFTYSSKEYEEDGFYFDMESELYNYKKITCYASMETDSENGSDKKSIEELKQLIPKMGLSRGYITTEEDLNNYFNLINTDENRMQLQKKIDNQLSRIWYCYLLMKDQYNNILPTNTLDIKFKLSDLIPPSENNSTYIIPANTWFKYDKRDEEQGHAFATIFDGEVTPYSNQYYEDGVYYYRSLYDILISIDPLYCSYYLTIVDTRSYFENEYLNPNMFMGFVVNTNKLERVFLDEIHSTNPDDPEYINNKYRNVYRFEYTMRQSVNEDFGLYDFDAEPHTNNMKVFLVVDSDGNPYRYFEGELIAKSNKDTYEFTYKFDLITDNKLDSNNNIKIINGYEVGATGIADGYFEDNASARIYILGKFSKEYGRYTIDRIIPGLEGYTLINIYSITNGIDFYNNFTGIMNSRVKQNQEFYEIYGVPFIGAHYFYHSNDSTNEQSNESTAYFIHELMKKKSYIDHCLTLVENNMDIDFKYFNTYGESKTYTIGDAEHTSLGHIDITMKFRAKLINANDVQTKNAIIQYIKTSIENLNDSGEDLHIPNLIHDLTEEFKDAIVYIEFMNFNDNRLGVNHIELKEITDIHTVPEFICVRNALDADGELEPWIDLEIVK